MGELVLKRSEITSVFILMDPKQTSSFSSDARQRWGAMPGSTFWGGGLTPPRLESADQVSALSSSHSRLL